MGGSQRKDLPRLVLKRPHRLSLSIAMAQPPVA
jgi:hypothetical protein